MSDSETSLSQSDIAIVGMALRVPGARSVGEFWDNLRNGVESIETRSPEQLIAAGESPDNLRRKNYVPRTAELPGLESFDAEFFGFSPKEAAIMDPQHRQFLECAWEALEDATRPPESVAGPVGVFAGCGMGSYFYFNVCSHRSLVEKTGMFLLRHTGNDKDFLATRASYAFDLHGPSVNVQTACSTSLVAIHLASQSLLNGECEMALAGGVTIDLPHRRGYLFQDGEILSTDGRCRAFDHRASGTVFGSGVGVVVLRRLADALADGDPIHAVIKATAINNDGASKAGYLAPSVTGQAEAIVEAQTLAGVTADSVGYVECHGTGTYLGDPIEIEALTQAFRQTTDKKGFCRVGSVKSNIGHLDTAAGVVSVIKAVLAVKHGQFPPTLGFEKPNPSIDFAGSPFIVNDRLTPWPSSAAPRRAGVNSLGVGGTNAHAIIEQAPLRASPKARANVKAPQVLVLSAKSRKALDDAGRRLAKHLDANPDIALPDLAHTLFVGRRHFEHRRVVAVKDVKDAAGILAQSEQPRASAHTPVEGTAEAVFLFPGGGAQYPHMARSLYRDEPAFRRVVDEGLGYLPAPVAQEIRDVWLEAHGPVPDAAERLLRPSLQLPAILIVEVALARLWIGWGVKPKALIGHSMGENAAACIAGVLSFERAVKLVRLRGELFDEVPPGGMMSVGLTADALKEHLPSDLDLASVNAPELCVVSGSNDALDAFRESLDADGIEASRIPINIAAHSRMLAPILARFEAFLRETPLSAPTIPIVSNLTGTWLTAAEARDATYWTKHLRSTVRYADGLAVLAADPSRVYIEVGPGRVLGSLAKAQGTITGNQVINSLPHPDEATDDRLHFLTALGRAWATGLPVPLEQLWTSADPRRIALPSYPFQHQSYFLERIAPTGSAEDDTPLMKLPDIASWGWQPVWKQSCAEMQLDAAETPASWLIFLDNGAIGASLVSRLRRQGHKVATVTLGDAFAVSPSGDYVLCPENGREDYDALIRHLAANGGLPERIVHLWLVTSDESHRPGSSFFHSNQERGFYSVFFLGQALADAGNATPIQLTIFTNGMQRLDGEPLPYPEKATVLGPAQVLPREMPNITVRVIDIPAAGGLATSFIERRRADLAKAVLGETAGESILDRIWEDILAANGNEIAAYRKNRRWTRSSEPLTLDAPADGTTATFREQGVYLITGGFGDLATACAEDLARRFRARLVLVGRTALPDRSEWKEYRAAYGETDRIGRAIAAITRIEEAGGEVLVARADITNSEEMQEAIAAAKERFGAIHGVLHTAGVIKDDLIQLKTTADIEDVFAPKILGTVVLAELLDREPLDLMVLFSSTSTDTTPAGQVDYVAANAYLNAFAESRAGKSATKILAVHWGVWKDVGMAARAIERAEHNDAPPVVEAARTPLFDRHIREQVPGHGQIDRLEARLEAKRFWVLDEHRLATGQAIWPGTGYIELIAEALKELRIEGAFEIEDLTFLRPLYVPDRGARTVRVSLAPGHGGYRVTIESEGTSSKDEERAGSLLHAQAHVKTRHSSASPARIDVERVQENCRLKTMDGDGAPLRSAQEDHLRFGPRWKVLRSAAFGELEAIARLELGEAYTADIEQGFLAHPALLDIATGYAMDLIQGYDPAAGLWVPMSYGKIRVHRPLPASIWSRVRLSDANDFGPGYATFDVTIADPQGNVVLEVEGFTVKQLPAKTDFSASLSNEPDVKAAAPSETPSNAGELSPALARLAAQVDQGILPTEGMEALLRALATGKPEVIISSMDLKRLQRNATASEAAPAASTSFDRPDLGVDFVEPETEFERTLAGFWTELLGIQKIGINDSFFDLGGHSLIAVRLFRMIKKTYAVEFPISVLFQAPTIAQCSALIEKAGAKASGTGESKAAGANNQAATNEPSHLHLVRMDSGKQPGRTPFFLCAGMFGNILNLRHLAVQIGADRPVYGLQARGIYGDQAPHETFEEMARDYLAEIKTVQPHGPYLLGGFSGGGLVAYEMAQQLRAAGEETAIVVLLDTPYPAEPRLSFTDRLMMKAQDIQRERQSFVGNWLRNRIAWEMRRFKASSPAEPKSADQFHNEEIEAAFRRALKRYQGKPYGEPVLLLRPKLRVHYRLSGDRKLNHERSLLRLDNGWTPYVELLTVQEVSGDHDSMVLEPNVRVLVGHLREALNRAEHGSVALPAAAE